MRQDKLKVVQDVREVHKAESIDLGDYQEDEVFDMWRDARIKVHRFKYCSNKCLLPDSETLSSSERSCYNECSERYNRNMDLFQSEQGYFETALAEKLSMGKNIYENF